MSIEFGSIYHRLRFRLWGSRVASEQVSEISQFTPPELVTPEEPVTLNLGPDYKWLASKYLQERIHSSMQKGLDWEVIVNQVVTDPVLKGIKPKQARSILKDGIGANLLVMTESLALKMPPTPCRDARRQLKLWSEKRSQPEIKKEPAVSKPVLKAPEKTQLVVAERKEVIEQPKHPVGLLYKKPLDWRGVRYGVKELTEDELSLLIKERSDKIAKGDQSLLESIQTIFDAVRISPEITQGSGIAKLRDGSGTTVIEGITYPLYRLSPRSRIGFSLPHPLGENLRLVYAIYKTDNRKIVVLDGDGLFTHPQYDKKYRKKN